MKIKHKNNKQIKKNCLICRREFWVSPYRRVTATYCSRVCTYKDHGRKVAGDKNYMWKGGASQLGQAARMTPEYKQWRLSVFNRDHFECQMCATKGKILNANHIYKFNDYPKIRFEIDNGITLCKDCHKKVTWHEKKWEFFFNQFLEWRKDGYVE